MKNFKKLILEKILNYENKKLKKITKRTNIKKNNK